MRSVMFLMALSGPGPAIGQVLLSGPMSPQPALTMRHYIPASPMTRSGQWIERYYYGVTKVEQPILPTLQSPARQYPAASGRLIIREYFYPAIRSDFKAGAGTKRNLTDDDRTPAPGPLEPPPKGDGAQKDRKEGANPDSTKPADAEKGNAAAKGKSDGGGK